MKLANLGLHYTRKTFNNKAALTQHLRSANHSGRKFTCPACLDRFDTLFSLAAHVESPSRKCNINREFSEKDMYRIFLDQLTLGMIEVGELFDNNTQKFEFQEEFKELYGPQKTSGPTFGHMQMRGLSSEGGNSAPPGGPGLTEAALNKHQRQIGKGGPRFTPPGQQKDSGRGGSGPEMALTADALSRLQLQEKRASPWGQRSGMNRPEPQQHQYQLQQQPQQKQQHQLQQELPGLQGQPPVPQQQRGSYVWQQLAALGWDTWDKQPRFREQDKECRVRPSEPSWRAEPKGGRGSGSGWS